MRQSIAYDIVPARREHWHYICDAFAETASRHDTGLSRESAFMQGLCLATSPNWCTVVATPDGDEILGFAIYHETLGNVAWVQVKNIYRGRGVGTTLLRYPVSGKGKTVSVSPWMSNEGYRWAKRRGVTYTQRPNLVWVAMHPMARNAAIEEMKSYLE